jgi:hypothetical protein
MKKGAIQNSELLFQSLLEGKEFVIVCKDEKDANSKRVSLYNSRRLLPESDQKRLQIQKFFCEGKWAVRILHEKLEVYEIVNGILVPLVDPLKDDSKTMLIEMLGQGMKEEEIIEILTARGETKDSVESEIRRLSL